MIFRDRMGISKQELVSMLEEDELKDAVLVVLANKQETLSSPAGLIVTLVLDIRNFFL